MMLRRPSVALALAALVSAVVPDAGAAACPSPKTCSAHALADYRWPTRAGQPLVITYLVNPTNPYVPAADVAPMVKAAARVWELANPRIRLRFGGTTDAAPGVEDGRNVVGWGPPLLPQEAAHAPLWYSSDGVVTEADLVVNLASASTWDPCPQRDGGCNGHASERVPALGLYTTEVQGLVTHELGHWLSLDHPGEGGELQTMHETVDTTRGREYQTLGLGDVLAVRAAYPCGRCGSAPRVFAP